MRGAIVNVAAKDRSASYQVIQYDVDELTGTWQGMFSDGQMNYGLKDVTIEKQEDGTYLLSNILTGLPYKLKAKAIDNCLAFGAGQNLGVFEDNLYLSFEILSSDLYYVKDPSVTISLGPVMLTDGTFVFAFSVVFCNILINSLRKKNGLVGIVRTKMYLCHSEILMPKDTKSLGNNKAPACESRGFVRKKQKVCILTHLLFNSIYSIS